MGLRVDATNYEDATRRILAWARESRPGYVCAANVHMVMEAYDCDDFRHMVNGAALVTPDGMPLVWGSRLLGVKEARQVRGTDLTCRLLAEAARDQVPVGFYGGASEVLERLVTEAGLRFPGLKVAYAYAPPFRQLTPEEDGEVVAAINASGARLLFVGLGCPKQERWMAEHAGRIRSMLLGVGAAFDFLAGTKPEAPRWLMAIGLEWLHRLVSEPKRLWRRYAKNNPRFMVLLLLQVLRLKRF